MDYDSSEEMGGKGKSRIDIIVNIFIMFEFFVYNIFVLRIIMDMLFFILNCICFVWFVKISINIYKCWYICFV